MDKHSHAGSPFAHLASFPTTSRWSKEVESGRGGVLGFVGRLFKWLFHLVLCYVESREEVLPFQVATKYVACINLSTRSSFLFVPRRTLISSITHIFPVVCLVLLERMCEMDSTLHSDVTCLLTTKKCLIEIILITSI